MVDTVQHSKFYVPTRRVARYILLPGIIPRIREMMHTPFVVLAALMLDVLAAVALVPLNHPYRTIEREGTFGVMDVLRLAARHIKWDLKHIDQVIVFFGLISAYVTMICFILTALVHVTFPSAAAMNVSDYLPNLIGNIYTYTATPHPERDVALMLLDRTLGVRGDMPSGSFFGSDIPNMCPGGSVEEQANPNCMKSPFPSAYNSATLALLQFYSTAIFMFAVLFLLYLFSTIVIDGAIKGKPIGREMNPFWGPLRLVGAIGLLIPLAPQGLNSAQYIVLYSAKVGSAFATNAWGYYHGILDTQMGISGRNPSGMSAYRYDMGGSAVIPVSSPLAAKLQAPDVAGVVKFLHLVTSCEYYYEKHRGYVGSRQIQGYFYRTGKEPLPAYVERDSGRTEFISYEDALKYFDYSAIRIVFGSFDALTPDGPMGGLEPLCGELVIPVSSVKDPTTGIAKNPGAATAHEMYYNYVLGLFDKTTYPRKLMDGYGRQMMSIHLGSAHSQKCLGALESQATDNAGNKIGDTVRALTSQTDRDFPPGSLIEHQSGVIAFPELGDCSQEPPPSYMLYQQKLFQGIFQVLIDSANRELANPGNFAISNEVLQRGWAASGTWFQHVARLNGDYVTAVRQMPYGAKRPKVMDDMRSMVIQSGPRVADPKQFCDLSGSAGKSLPPQDLELSKALCRIDMAMSKDYGDMQFNVDPNAPQDISGINGVMTDKNRSKTNNMVMQLLNTIMGTDFLFALCRNADTHPFTQIVTYGRELMEGTIRNVMTGSAIAGAAGVVSVGNADMGSSLGLIAGAYSAIGSMMFLAGFMLFYILPLLPFIYFFFGMIAWVKAVFEGLIGAPLWAFAHMKIDGHGFGTAGARQGYLLIFEIILRPILTVFALIMGLGIFSGSIYMLRETLELVIGVLGRPDLGLLATCKRDPGDLHDIFDVFFFNILYIILVYLIAMSSFKLIDSIPNSVMRWFGSSPKDSIAKASAASDHAGQRFTSQTYVVVANPLRDLIDKADDQIMAISKVTTELADQNGNIKRSVQSAVGKDRATRISEYIDKEIGPIAKDHASATGAMKGLENKLKSAKDPTEVARIKQDLEEAKRTAMLLDPELLYQEVMNPGSTKLKTIAQGSELDDLNKRLDNMKEYIRTVRPLVWEQLQTQTEKSGGVYVSQEEVHAAIKAQIKKVKQSAFKTK